MSGASSKSPSPVRLAWLAARTEPALDPSQPIVDAHHHLFDRPGWRYLLDDVLADLRTGHNIVATVYVQARAMLRAAGPEPMRPVGETEFANGVAAMCASGAYGATQVCAGIVGAADLLLGGGVRPVLEAHVAAGGGRFRGIRQIVAWDPDPTILNPAYHTFEDMLDSAAFREGFAELAPLRLAYDAWLHFHQIPRLTALARAFPDTAIVLDHCGGIMGIGRYEGRHREVFVQWQAGLRELAACPNVMVKLGGLGMRLSGFGFDARDVPPTSVELADAWRPWMETCIEVFGAARCMFESNFPVDKGNHAYCVGWNAMKRIAHHAGAEEKADLFWRSATRFYGLSVDTKEN